MISFESDYNTGAHEKIMEKLMATNREPTCGYERDPYSLSAMEKIRNACHTPDADIYFLVGGTQTNAMVISSLLCDSEGVLAAESGHVNVHEAGAIEYTGHKVLPLPSHQGLIDAEELENYIDAFYADGNWEHMVAPGMVYISYPSELGSLYTKKQLQDICRVCRKNQIPLYIDGARLGYGLMSPACDLTLPELADLCDVFYIGGTKVGALFGEAVCFPKGNAPKRFYTRTKMHGAMLAKGRLLGIQFDTLFTDGLYFEIGSHAMKMAEKLKTILSESGLPFYIDSPTNQQYVVIENDKMKQLAEKIAFSFWENLDENHTAIRFVTSWSTTEEDLEGLRKALQEL